MTKMSDIILYEKINRDKLREVLSCDNIPYGENDDPQWKESFQKQLKSYYQKKPKKEGIEIKYKQTNKYGRFFSNNGLQKFQKDVRKYICDGTQFDIDIENCHLVILEQLLIKNEIFYDKILTDYNNDRKAIIEEYDLVDKLSFIKFINNEKCSLEKFKKLHSQIYKLVDILIKDNKVLFQRLKKQKIKEKKEYNFKGVFLSHFLQNIENDILMEMYKYCNSKGFVVRVLCFDGLMVDKCEYIDETVLREMEKEILWKTGYDLKLTFKSMETEWVPNKIEDYISKQTTYTSNYFSKELASKLSDMKDEEGRIDNDKKEEFYEYMNNFLCSFENPHSYGWRSNIKYDYQFLPSSKIKESTGVAVFDTWNFFDNRKRYYKPVFKISEEVDSDEFNLYKQPPMKEGEVPEILFDFIKKVICSEDEDLNEYILTYLSIILKTGRTNQCLVLMGDRGIGKSSFVEIIRELIGNQYFNAVNDIQRLTSNFNAIFEKSILTGVEEVVNNAGEFYKVQNMIKTLITEKTKTIERKGIDSYITDTYNNFIICTNNVNPVQITEDNRRFCIFDVSTIRRKDRKYFRELKEAVDNNIEAIRYYFYNRPIKNELETIRPHTSKEDELIEINLSSENRFIKYEMVLNGEKDSYIRSFTYIYEKYKDFCKDNGEKSQSSKYFSAGLKKLGYTTERYGKNRKYYVQGFTENQQYTDEDIEIID